jgi:2-aminoadipate transaminase
MLHSKLVRLSQFDTTDLLANRARAGVDGGLIEILALAAVPGIISFAGGFPDPETFPRGALSNIMSELVESADFSALQYSPTEGLPTMLDLVAERLEHLEGHRPEAGELLITSGGIDGLGLISRSYLDRGDTVIVEGPTYLGALMAFRGYCAAAAEAPLHDP